MAGDRGQHLAPVGDPVRHRDEEDPRQNPQNQRKGQAEAEQIEQLAADPALLADALQDHLLLGRAQRQIADQHQKSQHDHRVAVPDAGQKGQCPGGDMGPAQSPGIGREAVEDLPHLQNQKEQAEQELWISPRLQKTQLAAS